ncbi:MAG: hypothetical protein BWY17_04203 [Deltaproteobacteria bacterium ADurb.Bin207]|jgi:hypothetical protein|nr:MAG: hypothetical protein BWY17_04203 [Deltaproteobacteria bacterium ADurb.Bin207]
MKLCGLFPIALSFGLLLPASQAHAGLNDYSCKPSALRPYPVGLAPLSRRPCAPIPSALPMGEAALLGR